ncbi:Nn.00g118100.m01.CDS01 [Neocucurbitaria sp. VM-36]
MLEELDIAEEVLDSVDVDGGKGLDDESELLADGETADVLVASEAWLAVDEADEDTTEVLVALDDPELFTAGEVAEEVISGEETGELIADRVAETIDELELDDWAGVGD